MFQHIVEYAGDMGVGGGIEDLLALALGLDDARRAQQAQVVAHQ
jgi:hypothetical protein